MKKKLSLISLILAAALTLSGCNSANELSSAAISSMIESAAQSAVESALAGFETNADSVPLTSPDVSGTEDTTTPAVTSETTAETKTAVTVSATTKETTTTAATTKKAETDKDTPPEKDMFVEPDTTTAPAETTAATTKKTETTTATTEPELSMSSKSDDIPKTGKREITNETMLHITNMKVSITKDGTGQAFPIMYNFNKKLSTGYVSIESYFFYPNEMIPLETDSYGIIGEVIGNYKVKFRVYNNTDKEATLKSSYIENATFMEGKWLEDQLELNKDITLDLSTLPDVKEYSRLWVVNASIKSEDKTINVWTFIFTNVDEIWLCAKSEKTFNNVAFNKFKEERKELVNRFITDKIDPKNELAVLGFMHYPRPDFDKPEKNKDETEDWVKLVKSIDVSGMSDERKVWTAYEWINNNIAYDEWERRNCRGSTGLNAGRARYYQDWSGKYDTYQIRCGVCWDMANLMAIFCRTWGIPTVVLSNKTHAWSAVYLNNRWVEFDCTQTNKYIVETEDVNVRTLNSIMSFSYLRVPGRIRTTSSLKEINSSLACCSGWDDLSHSFSA
ncbi:MAG: transglutaminase domain-containing protein [Ruminiclostridium sp.]|nr:transglutaminase domain-containing protein [Ruminiclostridium sp.]